MKEIIQKIDFFSGLEDKILKKLGDAAILRQFPKGEVIIRQGEMGLGMYVIVRGRVQVLREEGDKRIPVAELGPDQAFAEMSILDNKPRSATVAAAEETECLLLTRDIFVKLMQKYPEIPIRTAKVLAERLRVANEKLAAGPPAPLAAAAPEGASPAASTPTPVEGDGAAPPAPEGTKGQIQQTMLDWFQSLYTVKAFTRFSVALVGCPVEGTASSLVEEIRVGEVKALIVPAGQDVEVRLAAHGTGSFSLHVLQPTRMGPIRFGPVPVGPRDRFRLSLRPSAAALWRGRRRLSPISSPTSAPWAC